MTGRWWYVDDIRVSRELTADAITAGTLQGEYVNARKLSLDDYAEADYFNYRSTAISGDTDDDDFGKYFVRYQTTTIYDTATKNYYALILSGARGGEGAGMVRIESPSYLKYPIGMIITPGTKGGHQVHIECASGTFYYARGAGVSSTTLDSYATNSSYNSDTTSLNFGTASPTFSQDGLNSKYAF